MLFVKKCNPAELNTDKWLSWYLEAKTAVVQLLFLCAHLLYVLTVEVVAMDTVLYHSEAAISCRVL